MSRMRLKINDLCAIWLQCMHAPLHRGGRLSARDLRGQLVPRDPADGPASELLARIRAARVESSQKNFARKAAGMGENEMAKERAKEAFFWMMERSMAGDAKGKATVKPQQRLN